MLSTRSLCCVCRVFMLYVCWTCVVGEVGLYPGFPQEDDVFHLVLGDRHRTLRVGKPVEVQVLYANRDLVRGGVSVPINFSVHDRTLLFAVYVLAWATLCSMFQG